MSEQDTGGIEVRKKLYVVQFGGKLKIVMETDVPSDSKKSGLEKRGFPRKKNFCMHLYT